MPIGIHATTGDREELATWAPTAKGTRADSAGLRRIWAGRTTIARGTSPAPDRRRPKEERAKYAGSGQPGEGSGPLQQTTERESYDPKMPASSRTGRVTVGTKDHIAIAQLDTLIQGGIGHTPNSKAPGQRLKWRASSALLTRRSPSSPDVPGHDLSAS